MKPRYRLNNPAAEDLDDIWTYIAEDDQQAARAFIRELRDVFKRLSEFPHLGRQRDDLASGLRGFPHGNYIIFYRIKYETVEINRVIHGSRNLYAIFHSDN